MRDQFLRLLEEELSVLQSHNLRRSLRPAAVLGRMIRMPDGRELVNLSGNDYLALASHPKLKQAAINATQTYGTGAGASRLVTGTFDIHTQVEQSFATFKGTEAALLLPTGYMANLAVLTALAEPGDLVCVDKLNHASLIDAARASGADVRSYPHLQTGKLDRLLGKHAGLNANANAEINTHRPAKRFIVTDAVFSMDGDAANLPELGDLAKRHDAILIVDEAHATGVFGDEGQGLCHAMGIADRSDILLITVSTASKALGGLGGIIAAPQLVIDTLINRARSAIYTTAVPASQAAAIGAAIQVIREEPQRRSRLMDLSRHVRRELAAMNWQLPGGGDHAIGSITNGGEWATPILPLVVGDATRAISLASYLESQGFVAVAIRPPTVSPGSARVRLSLRCDLENADIEQLLQVIHDWTD